MTKEIREVFATKDESARRDIHEDKHSMRTNFDRDRDRILYSRAFRRLSGKTQVFLSGKDDHIRNRQSHTLEVSQIARTISRNLGLNEALTEAIALGHDLGHTPFGHVGERTLNYIMSGCDELRDFNVSSEKSRGFKHNWQSIRIATSLESCNGDYVGLNLTDYTLWGIVNHSSLEYNKCGLGYKDGDKVYCSLRRMNNTCKNASKVLSVDFYDDVKSKYINDECMSIEGLIVALADEIAQRHHDVEDALETGIISLDELIKNIESFYKAFFEKEDINRIEKIRNCAYFDTQKIMLSSFIVNIITRRVINKLSEKINSYFDLYNINTYEDFILKKKDVNFRINLKRDIDFDEDLSKKDKEFQKYIWNRILHSHKAQCMDGKGNFIIRELFKAYLTNPQQLPDKTIMQLFYNYDGRKLEASKSDRLTFIGDLRDELQELHAKNDNIYKGILMRNICDYIAGMTDKYALSLYSQLYENI